MVVSPEPKPEAKTPAEWSDIEGVTILDPDGWRKDRQPWETPITREDFLNRMAYSTIRWPVR